ncbi:hypothetical protein Forpe1208_v002586 [Fusarium oxysporum f. sp. rapae]|uniref:Uncharacterized protein n=1 Tax=Fusarium oxysporum f. sp. rapae TaxID=485398 RepID=A0A8J5PGC7_FUSOX|nr:hypothetical protein Forpe1208_v002586 [Fusarium oxysporum f. sp. rapae]
MFYSPTHFSITVSISKDLSPTSQLHFTIKGIFERLEECNGDKDAEHFIRLLKEAWFPTEKGDSIDRLKITVVKQLIKGLKHAALDGHGTPVVMWRSFIVQTCSSLHERPEDNSPKLVERIRRLHKTTTQAGIRRDDSYVTISGKDASLMSAT